MVAGDGAGAAGTPSAPARLRRAARVFAVASVIAMTLLAAVAERLSSHLQHGLDVADQAAAAARRAAGPADDLAGELAELVDVVGDAATNASDLAADASGAVGRLGTAAETNLADTIDGAARTADRLADAVALIEDFIPGNSSPSAADELRTIADGLEPVPGQLRTLGRDLQLTASQIGTAGADLATIESRLRAISARVEEARESMAALPRLIDRVDARIDRVRSAIPVDRWLVRLTVAALLALLLALAWGTDRLGAALESLQES